MTVTTIIGGLAALSVALCLIMGGAWFVWRATRNSGWVDTVWTFGLGAVGVGAAAAVPGSSHRAMLVAVLILIWALRLGLHIANRTIGIADDPRYARLIRAWGDSAPAQMFWLLQKQAWVSIPLALSMFLAAANPAPGLRAQDYLGGLVLLIGIAGEALADAQLRRFRRNPANSKRICDVGLWRVSRHPNYFFEWFGWIAYPVIAIEWSGAYPWGFVAVIGPICMYWLLVHVSGIPPLEEHMVQKHGAAFRDYQSQTSQFFPMPPRANAKAVS